MTLERPAVDDTSPAPDPVRRRADRRLIGGLISIALAAGAVVGAAITGVGASDPAPVTTELRPAADDEQVEPSTTVTTAPPTTIPAPTAPSAHGDVQTAPTDTPAAPAPAAAPAPVQATASEPAETVAPPPAPAPTAAPAPAAAEGPPPTTIGPPSTIYTDGRPGDTPTIP